MSDIKKWYAQPAVIFIYLSIVLFSFLHKPDIYILDEVRNAQSAREMWQSGNYVVPYFNNELRVQKPPLHYYAMSAAYSIFGSNSFSARFFSAICGLLTVLLVFVAVQKNAGRSYALAASWALALSTHFIFEFRLSVPDPYLILFNSLCIFSLFEYLQTSKSKYLFLAAFAAALSVLAKGPVGVALPGLTALIYSLTKKNFSIWFRYQSLLAALLFFVIAVPWFVLVHNATGGAFTKQFFLEQNVDRFKAPMEGHGGLFIVTIAFAFAGLLPGILWALKLKQYKKIFQENDLLRYCMIAVSAFLIFYSVAGTKLPNYAMPCYPFAAVIIGYFFVKWYESPHRNKSIFLWIAALYLLLAIAGIIVLQKDMLVKHLSWLGTLLLVLPAASIMAWLYAKNIHKSVTWFLTGSMLFNLVVLLIVYPVLYKENPLSKTEVAWKNADELIAYKIYNPAFNFYIDHPVKVFNDKDTLYQYVLQHPGAIILTRENLLNEINIQRYTIKAFAKDIFENPNTAILKLK